MMDINSDNVVEKASSEASTQVLTFYIDEDLYGVDISDVREVLEYSDVTRVPRSPAFMAGVINLRGHVVPVVNLRIEFELEKRDVDIDTCIVIFEFQTNDMGKVTLGCIVDSVNEVLEVNREQMDDVPSIGNRIDTQFIKSVVKLESGFVILLRISEILSKQKLLEITQDELEPSEVITE